MGASDCLERTPVQSALDIARVVFVEPVQQKPGLRVARKGGQNMSGAAKVDRISAVMTTRQTFLLAGFWPLRAGVSSLSPARITLIQTAGKLRHSAIEPR